MKIASGWSVEADGIEAANHAYSMLAGNLGAAPHFMLAHCSPAYDTTASVGRIRALAPDTPLHGGTTCFGVLTAEGFHSEDGRGIGLLGICDPDGSYGVGFCEAGNDPAKAGRDALEQALAAAGRPGEVPTVILISSYPGDEEHVILAIEEHVGAGVPIFGGTTADNDMSGQWQQFGNDSVASRAVSVAALFPASEIGFAFNSGFEPTEHRGRATRVSGRILYEIDGMPAARVYNEWTGGSITETLAGGSLVPTASLSPLGNPIGLVGHVPYYRIAYPVEVVENEALLLFTDAGPESEVVLMSGTHDSVVSRAGRVAAAAVESAPIDPGQVEGALILFCTGAMLVIKDRLDEAVVGIREALGGVPFLCTFTLGEQGCFIGGENRHANLMVAALVFGPEVE